MTTLKALSLGKETLNTLFFQKSVYRNFFLFSYFFDSQQKTPSPHLLKTDKQSLYKNKYPPIPDHSETVILKDIVT